VVELGNEDARVVLDPDNGGRVVSFAVGGLHLLRTPDDDPGGTHWGSFVMAPWAGRTRFGRFEFDGREHTLELNSGPHAIHGTVRDRPWTVTDSSPSRAALRCDFGPGWPFAGWVEQVIEVRPTRVDLTLSLHAAEGPMPAVGGWHPWWRRQLGNGRPVTLELPAGSMYARDADGIATDERVSPPPPGPWDDCFADLSGPPVLRWPGALELSIASDCPCVVVYDQPADSICVEPQSGPPDALNRSPAVATPGHPVVVHSSWTWRT
jgi:galactose mutarotase-like enzyme